MTCVSLYSAAPIMFAGLGAILDSISGFRLSGTCSTLGFFEEHVREDPPDLLVLELTPTLTLDTIRRIAAIAPVILWVNEDSVEFVVQAIRAGVRGILCTHSSVEAHAKCLREVAAGRMWVDQELGRQLAMTQKISLTPRERQVMRLIAQGLRNKEIAWSLGIAEGSVKVLLSRLFNKVGVNDRLELALLALRNIAAMPGSERAPVPPSNRATPPMMPQFLARGRSDNGRMADTDNAAVRDLIRGMHAGEMKAFFQPQVGPDERLTGFEALLRWNHPVRGMISPDQFVPVAEETGVINTLGAWIMAEACRNCGTWSDLTPQGLTVAVNASAVQFDHPDFVRQILQIVSSSHIDASRVTLEITETVILKDLARAAAQLGKLRAQGLHLALDDFGTGYASLACLAALPVDIVKLDRPFVARAIAEKPNLLESVINMAHRNGFRVIAEGVETAEQSMFLRNSGCDGMQGFYYGRPMTSAAVTPYIESFQARNTDWCHSAGSN